MEIIPYLAPPSSWINLNCHIVTKDLVKKRVVLKEGLLILIGERSVAILAVPLRRTANAFRCEIALSVCQKY